jgi:hypothetical protein
MLTKAWNNSITVENIKSGFRATGIFPFNPAAIHEDAYAPSTLYETSTSTDVPDLEESSQVNSTDISVTISVPTDSEQIAEVCSGESRQLLLQISDETATESIAADTNVLMDITIASDVPVVDLPLEFFQLESVTPTPKNVEGSETCSSTTALNVIESTMDYSTVSRYNKAYNDGRDLPEKKNPLYKSWKYYKDLSQVELSATPLNTTISLATESKSDEGADDLFALPKFKTTAKRSPKNQNQSFFVLTSDECYEIKR